MASSSALATILLTLIPFFFQVIPQTAQSAPAPAPESPIYINLTAILEAGGQYTILIRLLTGTPEGISIQNQIEEQLNNSTQGLTYFAPTDNAFNSLPAGTINDLTEQQEYELLWYHVLPEYHTLASLDNVTSPVKTEGTSPNGTVDTLNFITFGNGNLNVSSGIVTTPLKYALRQEYPLGVYEVDQVLLPESIFGQPNTTVAAPEPAIATNPAPEPATSTNPAPEPAIATNPSSSPSVSTGGGESVGAPSESNSRNVGLGLVAGIGLICIGVMLQ